MANRGTTMEPIHMHAGARDRFMDPTSGIGASPGIAPVRNLDPIGARVNASWSAACEQRAGHIDAPGMGRRHHAPAVREGLAMRMSHLSPENRQEAGPSWRQRAALVLRLTLRVFGGRQWSVPGLILRILTMQVLIALLVQRRSWYEALWGKPLCQPINVRTLPSEQRENVIEIGARACTLAAAVHSVKGLWIDEMRLHGYELLDPQTLGIRLEGKEEWTHTCLYDTTTALKAIVAHDSGNHEWVLVFGAQSCFHEQIPLDNPLADRQPGRWGADDSRCDLETPPGVQVPGAAALSRFQAAIVIFNLLGGRSQIFTQAASLAARLHQAAQERGLTLRCAGQSLGGGLATYAALHTQIHATVFNPIAIGSGLQAELGEQRLHEGVNRIDVFTASSDWASDPHWAARGMTAALNLVGLRTAAVIGRQWIIPAAYRDIAGVHDYILGSFSANLERIWACRTGRVARNVDAARRCRPSEIRSWNPNGSSSGVGEMVSA